MGTFCANPHVLGDSLPNARVAIRGALQAYAGVQGYRPSSTGAGSRRFLVHFGERWISILDTVSEMQSMEHESLAAVLSGALERPVVAFLVHDSDLARSALFVDGACVDVAEQPGNAGRPAGWGRVLAQGTPFELAAAWRRRHTFAEEGVREVARLLGIEEGWATGVVADLEADADHETLAFDGGRPFPFEIVAVDGTSDGGDWVDVTEDDMRELGEALRRADPESGEYVRAIREAMRDDRPASNPGDPPDDEGGPGGGSLPH